MWQGGEPFNCPYPTVSLFFSFNAMKLSGKRDYILMMWWELVLGIRMYECYKNLPSWSFTKWTSNILYFILYFKSASYSALA